MHFAFASDVADAVDHDPVALLAHVAGDAFELARQAFVFIGDQLQQTLGIDRGAGEIAVGRALGRSRLIGAGHWGILLACSYRDDFSIRPLTIGWLCAVYRVGPNKILSLQQCEAC
ncbi:hypothetical protein D3C73_1310860 [compost metagenome]